MEPMFFSRLEKVQAIGPDLISEQVDVRVLWCISFVPQKRFHNRSWKSRRTSKVIELNNRWRKTERAGMSQASLGMREHYTVQVCQKIEIRHW